MQPLPGLPARWLARQVSGDIDDIEAAPGLDTWRLLIWPLRNRAVLLPASGPLLG